MRGSCVRVAASAAGVIVLGGAAWAGPVNAAFPAPTFDRWNYPFFNPATGNQGLLPSFGALGTPGILDDRDAQVLVTYATGGQVAPGLGAGSYVVTSARVRATIASGGAFEFDPTSDPAASYAGGGVDADTGRPIELFGTGFRNGFTAASFGEFGPFSFGDPLQEGVRNAYAAGYQGGSLVDVSNHVRDGFDASAFAVGQATGLAPGAVVGAGQEFVFDLNVSDPLVRGYIASGLDAGVLSFSISSLHTAQPFGGAVTYPVFFSKENGAGAAIALELTVEVVPGPGTGASAVLLGVLGAARRRRR